MTDMSSFLVDDDHETWCLLSSGSSSSSSSTDDALKGLDQRWHQDQSSPDALLFWEHLIKTAQSLGFAVQSTSTTPAAAVAVSPSSFPAAFETTSGKKHVESLSKLLHADAKKVVQLTLGSLQDVNTKDQHLQSLLGTRSLFLRVLDYHGKQRSARVGIVTELLRASSEDTSTSSSFLSTLDKQTIVNAKDERGLLQTLLCAACAPDSLPTRDQVLPLQELGDEFFVQKVLQVLSAQRLLEREQAMEALLALLYSRLQVSCTELILLLLALQSSGAFFTSFANGNSETRLPHLAGLLCAEAINLNAAGPNHNLVQSLDELKLIKNVVMNFSEQVFLRREKCKDFADGVVPAPESIIMLAIGLLFKMIGSEEAMECMELANTCGAFEFIQATFDTLLPQRSAFQLGDYQDKPLYDWQFSDPVPTLSIEQDDAQAADMSANIVIYTSIGLELLRSVVVALHDLLVGAPDNLTALCHLGATLYANQPMLCDEFWNQPGAVGALVEAAFGKTPASWELLAAVCSNRDSVQRVMDMIPSDHLLESLATSADTVLPAIAKMAQFDPTAIREAVKDDPGVLFRILSFHPSNENVLEQVFDVMASLVRDCPSWAVTCVMFFGARSSHGLLAQCFSAGTISTVAAAARMLNALIEEMVVTCFTNTYSEHQVLEYVSVTVKATLAACNSLSNIFAFSNQPSVSYFNAFLILKASCDLLAINRQLRNLHTCIKVREKAAEARDEMLEAFATSTSFGQALAYFAGAPVSLSIGLLLEQTLQEADLLQLATEEYAVDDAANSMGKWHGILQKATEAPIETMARERLGDLKKVQIDMAAIRSRGWSDDESSPIHAAAAAIKLLKTWAMEAEDVFLTELVENKEEFLTITSPFRLLHATATMPPMVKATPKLAHLWPACGLSTSDMLVHLVVNTEVGGRSLPFHDSLALLSLSAAHAKYCGGLMGNSFKTASPLLSFMEESIEKAVKNESKEDVHNGILFVKLLGYILNVDFALGLSLLEHNNSAISNALAGSIKAIIDNQVSTIDRLGAESLRVIRLARKSGDIRADLVRLATISREPSLVCSELVAQSLEILAESELAGETTEGVQDLLGNLKFHKEAVMQFHNCIISMCTAMSKFRPIALRVRSCVNLTNPSLFAQSFPSGDTRSLPDMMSLNQYDTKAAASVLYSLSKEQADAGQIASATEDLLMCMVSVKTQASAVAAWTRFLQVSVSTIDGKMISPELVKIIEAFIVDSMHELAKLKRDVEQEVASLSGEIEVMFAVTSTLLLDLNSLGSSDSNLEHIDLKKLLEAIEVIAPKPGSSPTTEVSISLNNLLAVAAVVLQSAPSSIDLTRFVHIVRQAMFIRDDKEIFRTALALLTAVLHNESLVTDRRARAKIATAMSENGLVNALVDEVSAASARAVKDKESFDEDQVATVQSLITVLLDISNAGEGEASFGALFLRSNLFEMLLSNPLFAQAIPRWAASGADSHYRGYIKSSSKRANEGGMERVAVFLSGRSDPVHEVWKLAIRLVTSLLRVSARHGRHHDFQKLALDFIREYDGVLRSCLAKCSAVGQNSVLTHNLVDEADETLALLSELSTKSDGFLDIAVSVVGSLGKFLGAIGTSRFLFKLAQDVEAANQEQDSPFGNLQALHPALSGGVANARFEAIRYAHYARSAYAMVTSDDQKQFSTERGSVPSGNDLEKTCYKAINNSFCAGIEVAVAYCLTNALTLLSKTHPASRSFMLFSQEESRRLNPFTIVRVGAIIAVHDNESLEFARVISSDTVRRSWKCMKINPDTRETAGEEVTVSVNDLAGVEDVMKRKVLFQYLSAPDAATELENPEHSKSSNIGHLILTLRWCREGENGIDAEVRTDLAESASALLATELALHREIGTDKLDKDAVAKNVNDQLFDLLDSQSKFPGLTSCLSLEFMHQIRGQLHGMLDLARKDRAEELAKYEARLAAMNASNPFFR